MRFLFLSAACFFVVQVQAQQVLELSFQEAVKTALQNNISLEQAENNQHMYQAAKLSSVASIAPTVSGNASGYKLVGNQFIEQEGKSINDAETSNLEVSLNAQMVLFGAFERHYRISSANATLESQIYTVKRSRQEVIRDVANQYLQVLLDQELLRIAEENFELQKTQQQQIQKMVELGSRAEVEFITQNAQLKQAEVNVLRAKNTLMNDKLILARLLLLDPEVQFTLIEPAWTTNDTQLESVHTAEELIYQAVNNRGDLQSALLNEKATRYNFKASKSEYFPELSAFFSSGSFYSDASIPTFNDQFDSNLRIIYGLNLSIPIFSGLQRYSASVQAKVQHENAALQSKELNNRVKSEVIMAVQNYKDAVLTYDAAKSSLEASEMSFRLEEERFNLGVTDLVEFAQANQVLVTSKSDFAQAYYTLAFQEILMKFATGTLSPEDIPQ